MPVLYSTRGMIGPVCHWKMQCRFWCMGEQEKMMSLTIWYLCSKHVHEGLPLHACHKSQQHYTTLVQTNLANVSATVPSSCKDMLAPSLAASASCHAVKCTFRPLDAAAILRLWCAVLSGWFCRSLRDHLTPASIIGSETKPDNTNPGCSKLA